MKSTLGVRIVMRTTIDLPSAYLQQVMTNQNIGCPILSNWLFIRQPQFFSVADRRDQDSELRKLFVEHGLRNILLHGHVDADRELASFFGLFNLPDGYRAVGELLAPPVALRIHHALLDLHDAYPLGEAEPNSSPLTSAEMQVHRWLCEGKTNWEISRILNKSEWTVKTQVQRILQKLNAPSRRYLMIETREGDSVQQKQNASSRRRGVVLDA